MNNKIIIALVLIAVLYFAFGIFILPSMRQKRLKMQQEKIETFQKKLKISDNVLTMAGIYGVVQNIEKNIISLEIAPKVIIKVDKSTVMAITKHKNI